ncbi:exo-beta-N-acetylmuramidase NamZ domain-containing protein [Aeoliella sp. SH292]|uniref:exo-beta-N-acetylmuramidase NamZ domain-containing protein n=1 Tax=Aeoliella sp. SH292 TaxID=3454464 RepID=UPI003F9D6A19
MSIALLLSASIAWATEPSQPVVTPAEAGMSEIAADIDQAVAEKLKQMRLPGCVVVVGREGKIVHRKAYGLRRLEPGPELMTVDTVFDMASLTKPIATSTSIMQLVEQGKLRLDDKVSDFFPEFAANGKSDITVEHLLLHSAGLIPDTSISDYQEGWSPALAKICELKPLSAPGAEFKYSDVGFQLLGAIVEKVSGQTLDEYTREHVFGPLGMNETMFNPGEELRERAATTEKEGDDWLRGIVHDPRARKVGGIAGHAGLFSTADDLARYANALLGGGAPLMNSSTFENWTTSRDIDGNLRGLGWDMRSGYSKNRGKHMSPRAIGHGGFTGTAMWIDPGLDLFVIFLSNRVHPDGKGEANELAGRIGTIASAACTVSAPAPEPAASTSTAPTVLGIDALVADGFAPLRGKRVGLIANHTSINAEGKSTIDLLASAPDVKLVALFSPEHGLRGTEDHANITDSIDEKTKLPVYSLYGKTNKPTPEQLADIDVLVFDIQDIGCRFYTYLSTMGLAMEAAAEAGKAFVVLDRPNPIGGHVVEGPVLDAGDEAFVGYHTIPVRHGMTMGELAGMIMAEKQLDLDLTVVQVQNWDRNSYLYETGLPWVNTSPNMRSLTEALLYPGVGLFETTNVSVGRGTGTPFELFGAPWIDGRALADKINAYRLPGVEAMAVRFTPDASKFEGEPCGGVNFIVTDWETFRPVNLTWCVGASLVELYPDQWEARSFNRLLINKEVHELVSKGVSPAEIEASYADDLEKFLKRRQQFLLY